MDRTNKELEARVKELEDLVKLLNEHNEILKRLSFAQGYEACRKDAKALGFTF